MNSSPRYKTFDFKSFVFYVNKFGAYAQQKLSEGRYTALGKGFIMNIYICVGSSCHIKGSYDIIQLMKEAVATNRLEDKVNLSAAFCLGRCTDGVTVKIDEDLICGVSKESFPDFFEHQVLARLN